MSLPLKTWRLSCGHQFSKSQAIERWAARVRVGEAPEMVLTIGKPKIRNEVPSPKVIPSRTLSNMKRGIWPVVGAGKSIEGGQKPPSGPLGLARKASPASPTARPMALLRIALFSVAGIVLFDNVVISIPP